MGYRQGERKDDRNIMTERERERERERCNPGVLCLFQYTSFFNVTYIMLEHTHTHTLRIHKTTHTHKHMHTDIITHPPVTHTKHRHTHTQDTHSVHSHTDYYSQQMLHKHTEKHRELPC